MDNDSSYSPSTASEESTRGTKNKAQCISNVSNWSKSKPNHLFDKPDAFVPESVKAQMADASPKLVALFDKIRALDSADISKHGHLFKHMIFSGNPVSNHGSKIVAAAFLAEGFELTFDAAKETGALRHKPMEHLEKHGKNMLSLLMSKPLFGKPMTSYFKKHTLQLFNARPENVHGDIVRFICLDGGFREGIDLFDIKYIHLLEPTPIKADERQAIGRGTRFCGQKGITFDPKRGWPLYVFRYEVSISPEKRANFQGAETFLELQLKYSDIDIREVTFAAELESVAIEGAVDKQLTKPVHEFIVPPDSTAGGGSKDIVYLSVPKLHLDVYDGDRSSASVMLQLGQRTAAKEKEPAKSASHASTSPHPPRKIMGHKRMQEFVSKYFSRFQYPPVKLENGCVGGGGSGSETESSTTVGGATSVIASFTPTQDFVRHFFQPSSAYKGMLLYHSVGTGKCHAKDTPILMYDGNIKMVQDIQVGEFLMGDDSTPREVLSLANGSDEMYNIIPVKGDTYTVNSEHILCLKPTRLGVTYVRSQTRNPYVANYFISNGKVNNKSFATKEEALIFQNEMYKRNPVIEISVKDYLKLSKSSTRNLKGYRVGVEFQEKKVDIDPYLIGLWLGDGTARGPCVATADTEIVDYLIEEAVNLGLHCRKEVAKYGYRISSESGGIGKNLFMNALKKYNLVNNKHIPIDYKANDRTARMKLLAGLIDSDGYKDGTGFEIIQKRKNLADDIVFIARSLGFAAYVKPCVKSCRYKGKKVTGTYHRITISGDGLEHVPVKLDRKKSRKRLQKKGVLVTGIEVKHVGIDNYYGFTLDGNNRYLLGDCTVTHNTCTAVSLASTSFEKEGYNILWVTRHTLKADITKNQFGIVCNVAMQERLRKGLAVGKPNLSKAWLNPISYKQFSNMLLKKNKVYFDMVARNGVDDPLRKTLIVIDEAHKLYAPDTPKAEQPDTYILEEMLHKSYEESGADSARVILMTATPYTRSAMEMIRLLNLIRPKQDTFPVDDEFYNKYLNAAGRFTSRGKAAFMDEISGYISYLNRSSDARNFAYPIIKDVSVEMSASHVNPEGKQNKYMKKIKDLKAEKPSAREEDKALQEECIGKAQSNVDADAARLDERKHAATSRKEAALDRCAELPKERKTGCKTEAQAQYKEAMESIKAETTAGKEALKNQKKECKEIKQNTEALLEKIRQAQEEYDVIKKEKTLLKEESAISKRELLTVSNEYKRLSEAKRREMNELKNLASATERKHQRKVIQEKYANMPSLVARMNQIRQQLQNATMRMNVLNEKIGIRLAEDMSQETALRSRCAVGTQHRRASSPSPRGSSSPRRSPSPPHRNAPTTKKSPSYVGPSVANFQAEFQSAFATSGKDGAKKAYRKLTLQYHPDKHPSETKKYEAIFKVLQQAWQSFKLRRNIAGGDGDDSDDGVKV